MEHCISISDLTFAYKDQKDRNAVEGISLDIKNGEFIVILGPSGAGKSTLASCLNGIIPRMTRGRYSGNVTVNGKEAAKHNISQIARDVGLVFQDFENQLFSTNVSLEIAFSPENYSVPRDEITKIIKDMLELVGLKGFENREPSTLSGGQKQRLAIGSVMAGHPSILCMDEPTTDLDPIGKLEVFNIADRIRKDWDITLIIIEHETEEALMADRVIIMQDGKIARMGTPQEILTDVEFFDASGIMPLQIPKFFVNTTESNRSELPMLPPEGVVYFKKHNYRISTDRYRELLARDIEREARYGEVLIDVKGLSHVYPNGFKAVADVDMQVREGEFLAVLGQNGSGKTTFVKHLNGLLKPSSGSCMVCGMDTSKQTIYEIGRSVGFVFQNPDHQIFSETVREEVAFSPKLRGVPEDQLAERMKEALHAVDLDGYEEKDPFTLSKGERQRVAVASVLSAQPRIIILDEPTTGLDYKEQRRMMELIKRLNENGHTVIIITHTMWVVAEYAHKVAVFSEGKLAMYGRTRDVFSNDEKLRSYSLRTPHIVNMSNMLGSTILSLDEMEYIAERG